MSVFLKIARSQQIVISQAIACNYIMASSLTISCYSLIFKGYRLVMLYAKMNTAGFSYLVCYCLHFLVMAKAIEHNGIARVDAAQRLSLFTDSRVFFTFGEPLIFTENHRYFVSILSLICFIFKHKADGAFWRA